MNIMDKELPTKIDRHVTFCSHGDANWGRQAELDTVFYLVNNLSVRSIGDYRLLVNYNLPPGRGSNQISEIDVVIINKHGLFVVEVKNWNGIVEAHDDCWVQTQEDHTRRYPNVFLTANDKARALRTWFDRGGSLSALESAGERVSVVSIIVLAQGRSNFVNRSIYQDRLVYGIDPQLLQALSSPPLPGPGRKKLLSDEEISRIKETFYHRGIQRNEVRIGDYRIVGPLTDGELFESFEAVNVRLTSQRVRIKRYHLNLASGNRKPASGQEAGPLKLFWRNAEALSKMETHANILQTMAIFEDPDRPDYFYEVTEFVRGRRLDEIAAQCRDPLSFSQQLDYVLPLCAALNHAHKKDIFHRNLQPAVVYVSEESGTVKLADFNFAKILGAEHSVSSKRVMPDGQAFPSSLFSAPEILSSPSAASAASDLYSLGAVWFFLVCLPGRPNTIAPERIEQFGIPIRARALMKSLLNTAISDRPARTEEVLRQLEDLKAENT